MLDGETFLHRAVTALSGAGLQVLVVMNPDVDAAVPSADFSGRRVVNSDPDHASGMFGSVKLGVSEALRLGATGVLLLPVDHPLVTRADARSVAAALDAGAKVAVAVHEGRWGHPVGVSLAVMNEIASDPGLTTLRDLVRRDRSRVVEAPASRGVILGVNTREDLDRVSNRTFR
jgi:CTP:molybdopterin cytidylyltransferase MocA